MFSRHYRKVKAIFGATDVLLTSLAFFAAYRTRILLPFEKNFYLDFRVATLLLAISALCWVMVGYWFEVYEKLDSAHPQRGAARHVPAVRAGRGLPGAGRVSAALGPQPFVRCDLRHLRLDSLCLFRINAARVIGAVRKQFGTAHYVMVVGSGDSARHAGTRRSKSRATTASGCSDFWTMNPARFN